MFQRRNIVIVQPPTDKVAKLTLENQRLHHKIKYVRKGIDNSPPKRGYVDHSIYQASPSPTRSPSSMKKLSLAADLSRLKDQSLN